jgi:rsbT antagonist protein RsbS
MTETFARVPLIRLWNVILVPLQGELGDEAAARLTDDVLESIHRTGAAGLVLDITGLWMVDSHLCAVLTNLATAAGLVGAKTVISGMSPEIAMTLQAMGAELRGATTALSVEGALERLGIRATPEDAKKKKAKKEPRDDDAKGGATWKNER